MKILKILKRFFFLLFFCCSELTLTQQLNNMTSSIEWFLFNLILSGALIFDLNHKRSRNVVADAIKWTVFWIAAAGIFAFWIYVSRGATTSLTFLTGYLVEKSLSVDNLLVILLIFKHFRIRPGRQPRVLKLGIWGAVFFRALFIYAGSEILEHFEWAVYIFGLILLYAAYKTMYDDDESEDTHDDTVKPSNSIIVRVISSFVPYTTNPTTTSFFLRSHHSKRLVATPMLAALLVIESTDILFAIDSIPCILGLTNDRYIVYSSNMFAILGLRSLYILLADALHRVKYLQTGLAFILGFVGFKMVVSEFLEISQTWSLLVIVGILVATVGYENWSLLRNKGGGKHNKKLTLLPKYREAYV